MHIRIIVVPFLDLCPVVFNEQIAVELDKVHEECLVQVQIAPSLVYFTPPENTANLSAFLSGSTTTAAEQRARLGQDGDWMSLDALQFRGHGLYSDKEVPWAVEVLEYAWMVEVVVGKLNAKLQPSNVSCGKKYVWKTLVGNVCLQCQNDRISKLR